MEPQSDFCVSLHTDEKDYYSRMYNGGVPDTYGKSVLIFQMVHHPFRESLRSVLNMDFTGLKVHIFYAIYSSPYGSQIITPKEYLEQDTIDATSPEYQNKQRAQEEKTRLMQKLVLDGDYDYALLCADDVQVKRPALQLLVKSGKDFISGLVGRTFTDDENQYFSGRIYDPDGPQNADDRPIKLHKDFEYGDIIPITNGTTVFLLISRKVFQLPDYWGFNERSVWSWLEQWGVQAYCHTGVKVKYLGKRQ